MSASLRDFIAGLEQVGELLDLDEPLSTDFELAGALSLLEAGPALRCTPSGPFSMRVVGNVVNSRARIARALRVPQERVSDALLRAIAEPLPPAGSSWGHAKRSFENRTSPRCPFHGSLARRPDATSLPG